MFEFQNWETLLSISVLCTAGGQREPRGSRRDHRDGRAAAARLRWRNRLDAVHLLARLPAATHCGAASASTAQLPVPNPVLATLNTEAGRQPMPSQSAVMCARPGMCSILTKATAVDGSSRESSRKSLISFAYVHATAAHPTWTKTCRQPAVVRSLLRPRRMPWPQQCRARLAQSCSGRRAR